MPQKTPTHNLVGKNSLIKGVLNELSIIFRGRNKAPVVLLNKKVIMTVYNQNNNKDIYFVLSTDNDTIEIVEPLLGKVKITIDKTLTENVIWTEASYDIKIVEVSNSITPLVQGRVVLENSVTVSEEALTPTSIS